MKVQIDLAYSCDCEGISADTFVTNYVDTVDFDDLLNELKEIFDNIGRGWVKAEAVLLRPRV